MNYVIWTALHPDFPGFVNNPLWILLAFWTIPYTFFADVNQASGDSEIYPDSINEGLSCFTSIPSAEFKGEQQFAPDKECGQVANAVVKVSSHKDEHSGSSRSDFTQVDREQFSSTLYNETVTVVDSKFNSDLRTSDMACLKSTEGRAFYDNDSMNKAEKLQRIKFHCPPKPLLSPVLKAWFLYNMKETNHSV